MLGIFGGKTTVTTYRKKAENTYRDGLAYVEGMIMAGDRIYVYGNNNIVSNRDVLRAIITQEIEEDGINEDAMPENSRYVKDYIGGLVDQGVIE